MITCSILGFRFRNQLKFSHKIIGLGSFPHNGTRVSYLLYNSKIIICGLKLV
jgi:hypothetical protein